MRSPVSSTPGAPGILVIVVTWNSAQVLPGLLASLDDAVGTGAGPWHLVVVDNASADDTVDVARRMRPTAKLVQTGCNAGYAGAVNVGLRERPAGWDVVVLNPDVRLDRQSLARLVAAVRSPGGPGIAVPVQRSESNELLPTLRRSSSVRRALGEALLGGNRAGRFPAWGELVVDPRAYERETTADWASGSVVALSAACADGVGDWDESFFLYSEETEVALRAHDLGWSLRLVPSATCVHLQGESHVSRDLWALLMVNRWRLHRRRRGAGPAIAFQLALLIGSVIRAARGDAPSRAASRALVRPQRSAEVLVAQLSAPRQPPPEQGLRLRE